MELPPPPPDDFYQPPSVSFVPAEQVAETQTANGSYIRVGQRKKFTGAFTISVAFGLTVVLTLQVIALGAFAMLIGAVVSPLLGVLLVIILPVTAYALLLPWYAGIAIAHFMMKPRNLDERAAYVVGVRFAPRLTTKASEATDGDDDTGVISPVGEFLEYKGDRIEMKISRQDVRLITRQKPSWAKLGLIGPDVSVEFEVPILRCRSMRLVINEGLTTWAARRRSRQLAEGLEQWNDQTRNPTS